MFRTSVKKTSQANVLSLTKYAAKFKATLELELQAFLEDNKIEEQLKKIMMCFQHCEKTLSEKTSDPVNLTKDFQKSEVALGKVAEKLQEIQTYFVNAHKTLSEKLISKLKEIKPPERSSSKTHEENKKRIEMLIQDIQALLAKGKHKAEFLHSQIQSALKLQQGLKQVLNRVILPECIAQCGKHTDKLSEKLDYLCKTSSDLQLRIGELPSQGMDIAKVHANLSELELKLKKCYQLFDQTVIHLKPHKPLLMMSVAEIGGGAVNVGPVPAPVPGPVLVSMPGPSISASDKERTMEKDKEPGLEKPKGVAANETLFKIATP